jgi:glutamyl-tRNA synthetase
MTDAAAAVAERAEPRVRMAPSPTGYFHVGSARAALFNWFFARQRRGTLVLRIEDTDEARSRTEWTEGIISAMTWLGMAPDAGPYLQSDEGEAHQAAIEALWSSGALYACACTREEIDARVKERAAAGNPTPGYDGFCRDLGLERGEGRALRFRTPDAGTLTVDDLVRGVVEFPLDTLEDFICVRGDGTPLFALANAVDDRTMAMTHVIRGEDLLPSTPRQVLLWEALNRAEGRVLPLPSYAHLPLLVNEQGKKLSKRRDPVAVELYREQGYLPAAFRNYLALLGWSPGDEEILPVETLIERFALEDVQKSPAFFDVKKLSHFNGVYIRMLSVPEFIEAARPWVDPVSGEWAPGSWIDPDTGAPVVAEVPWPASRYDEVRFAEVASVAQERVAVLSEVPTLVDFLFLEDAPIDEASWQKAIAGDEVAAEILAAALAAYGECAWDKDTLHAVTLEIAEAAGRKLGKAQAPIRVAVMGRTTGLPLFDSLAVLGRDETRRRIAAALARSAPAA